MPCISLQSPYEWIHKDIYNKKEKTEKFQVLISSTQ